MNCSHSQGLEVHVSTIKCTSIASKVSRKRIIYISVIPISFEQRSTGKYTTKEDHH